MTAERKDARTGLARLADALVGDIMDMTDEEILAEFRESDGDPDHHAAEMRDLLQRAAITANKKKLVAARAGLAASRQGAARPAPATDIADARRRLRSAIASPHPQVKLTLAARKESELSDADVLGIIADLQELGVLPADGEREG